MSLYEEYMRQTSSVRAQSDHNAHNNGSVHTNSSGSHGDTKSTGGSHGDSWNN